MKEYQSPRMELVEFEMEPLMVTGLPVLPFYKSTPKSESEGQRIFTE